MKEFKSIFFLIFLNFYFLQADEVKLSESEKEWLSKDHVVKVRVSNSPPFMILDKGHVRGIAIDYIEGIFKKHKIKHEYVYHDKVSWSQALKYIKKRNTVDLVPAIKITDERKKYISFTKNYLFFPLVIFTRDDTEFITGIEDLKGKTMVVPKGYVLHDLLKKNYPEIKLKVIDGSNLVKRSMEELASSNVDAFIGNLTVGTYIIQNYGFNNIKVAAPSPFPSLDLSMGIRNDWTELTSIIDKNLKNISQEEKVKINNKWMPVRYEFGVSWTEVWAYGFLAFLISMIIIMILKNNNKKLKCVLNSSIEGIFILKDRKIIEFNEPLKNLLKYTKKETKGIDVLDFVDKKYYKQIIENQNITNFPYEIKMKNKDGIVFPVLVKSTDIGNGKRVVSVIDLTELKRIQNELKELNENLEEKILKQVRENREKDRLFFQQSKLAAMGEMINNIAHQWRQPLNEINSIVMTLDLELMKRDEKNNIYEQMLNGIEVQTKYMSETIDNFSRYFIPEKVKTEFYFSETAIDAMYILEQRFRTKNVEIEYELKSDKTFKGFPSELVQVLIIILNNAIDALSYNKTKNPKIFVLIDKKIIIEDNAGGIDESIINRVFEPYFTTKEKTKGRGVGLYMAKMIIEDSMYGLIEVKNTSSGAKFTISL